MRVVAVVIVVLAAAVSIEYLVIGLFVVPRLARLADGRGGRLLLLAQVGAAAFFFGCAVTHGTLAVQQLTGGTDAPTLVHLLPHLAQVIGGGAVIWAVFTGRLSVQLLEQHGIDAENLRTRLAAVVLHSRDAILTKDASGRITSWNAAAARLYGFSSAEVLGRSVSLIVPPHHAGEESSILARVLAGETIEHYETERLCRDGSIVEMSLTVSPIYGPGAIPLGASVIGRNITERSRAARRETLLAEAGPRLEASLDVGATAQALARLIVPSIGSACAVDVVARDGQIERVAAVASDADEERALWDVHYAEQGKPSEAVRSVLASGEAVVPLDGTHELDADGHPFALLPLVSRGSAIGCVGVRFRGPSASLEDLSLLRDLLKRAAAGLENARLHREAESARAAAELASADLVRAQIRFQVAFEEAPIGVALVSMQSENLGRFLKVNPAMSRITGYSREALERRTFMSLTHPEDQDVHAEPLERMVSGEASEFFVEKRCLHANGHPIWVQVSAKLVSSPMGEPLYSVAHYQDVTDQKRYQGQLQYLADHDALTGLFNRRRLEEELARAAAHVERYLEPASLLVVDLDNFKYYNDTFGHAVGDNVMTHACSLLRRHSRTTDTVARLGGDEFAIVLPHTDKEGAEIYARHLLALLRSSPLVHRRREPAPRHGVDRDRAIGGDVPRRPQSSSWRRTWRCTTRRRKGATASATSIRKPVGADVSGRGSAGRNGFAKRSSTTASSSGSSRSSPLRRARRIATRSSCGCSVTMTSRSRPACSCTSPSISVRSRQSTAGSSIMRSSSWPTGRLQERTCISR